MSITKEIKYRGMYISIADACALRLLLTEMIDSINTNFPDLSRVTVGREIDRYTVLLNSINTQLATLIN